MKHGATGVPDLNPDEYDIAVDVRGLPHTVSLIAAVAIPLIMVVGAVMQSGFAGLMSLRMLILIPVIAALVLAVRYTKGLGSVKTADIEHSYDNMIVVEGSELGEGGRPLRPGSISIRTKDGSTAPFAFITRYDWERDDTTRIHQGMLVVHAGRVAVMIADDGTMTARSPEESQYTPEPVDDESSSGDDDEAVDANGEDEAL